MSFDQIASYYDTMYVDSEAYKKEAQKVLEIVNLYSLSKGRRLLDLACGTGEQSLHLSEHFDVTGLDFSEDMLNIARKKVLNATFEYGDMNNYEYENGFDVIVNLYGSIGFVNNYKELKQSVICAYKNMNRGGIYILTPWSTKETFSEGIFSEAKNSSEISTCRMESIKRISESKIKVQMFHLIGKGTEIKEYRNEEEISLFTEKEYRDVVVESGFELLERLSYEEFRMGAFICRK